MTTFASMGMDSSGRYDLQTLESRGPGKIVHSPWFLFKAAVRIMTESFRGRLAIVHLNLAERGSIYRKGFLLATSRLVGVPALVHLHAAQIIGEYEQMGWLRRRIVKLIFQSADHVVVLGNPWRHWLVTTLGIPHYAVQIVRNGVPDHGQRVLPRQPEKPVHLLFLGNLLKRKGLLDLLVAMSTVVQQGQEVTLTVAGGGDVDEYHTHTRRLGIDGLVTFTGWLDQTRARSLLAVADVLILPSYDEGLPLVILEALAAGVPVICSPVGAIPEVLSDGETALFVTPGDQQGLADAISRLVDDLELWNKLAKAGRLLYEREFTLDSFAACFSKIYAQLDEKSDPQRSVQNSDLKANAGD